MNRPTTQTLRWAVVDLVAALALAVAVLRRTLDGWTVGASHGQWALDYFSTPRAFLAWRAGHGFYAGHLSNYGPYATPYLSHPLSALFWGGALSRFAPWTGYRVFVALSALVLAATCYSIQRSLKQRVAAWATPFVLMISLPAYLMLWNGQLQLLTIPAFAAVLIAVQRPTNGPVMRAALSVGLLLSLFSKPILLLALVPLVSLKSARRTICITLVLYAGVSVLFLLAPLDRQPISWSRAIQYLQTGHGLHFSNAGHWLGMLRAGTELDRGGTEYFSLPALLLDGLDWRPSVLWLPVFLAPVGVLGWLNARRSTGQRAADNLLLLIVAAVDSHFLSYPVVWEYHYATLSVAAPFVLNAFIDDQKSVALLVCLICILSINVPTPYIFFADTVHDHLSLLRLSRVGPALVLYVALCARVARQLFRADRAAALPVAD